MNSVVAMCKVSKDISSLARLCISLYRSMVIKKKKKRLRVIVQSSYCQRWITSSVCLFFTLEHGTYFPPGGHPALTGVLAQRSLQKKHRDATAEKEHTVGDEKDPWNHKLS